MAAAAAWCRSAPRAGWAWWRSSSARRRRQSWRWRGHGSSHVCPVGAAAPEARGRQSGERLAHRGKTGDRIGQSGDGGIDGIIKEDKLGLDAIYIQAKRWQGTVGRPDIQKFVGALHGQRARKGVFMTTSNFSPEARDYVAHIDVKVVLLDGMRIANLMIDSGVGVTPVATCVVKRLDSDYFDEA